MSERNPEQGQDPTLQAPLQNAGARPSYRATAKPLAGLRWVQVAALGPLLALAVACACSPVLRQQLDTGLRLLISFDLSGLRQWAAALGPWAPLGTTLLMIAQAIVAPIPAVLVTATNSWLFGWVAGGMLSILAATLAALLCYAIARSLGEPVVLRVMSRQQIERTESAIERHGFMAILAARLLPFVPFDPISYVAGLTRMPIRAFFWATLVGQIPAGMTYSYLAQYGGRPDTWLVVVPSALLGVYALVVIARSGFLPNPLVECSHASSPAECWLARDANVLVTR